MNCPYNICGGIGFIPITTESGEQEYAPCKCRIERDTKQSIRKKRIEARIPIKFWDYTFENYKKLSKMVKLPPSVQITNDKYVGIIEKYIDDPKLFLSGPQVLWIWGTDENSCHTTLAVMLGDSLLKFGTKVVFLEFYRLIEMFKDFDNKADYFNELKTSEVFIIDDAYDVTRCQLTEYGHTQMFGFINDILNDNKHLICTSNTSVNGIVHPGFKQMKIIIERSLEELKIQGSFTPILRQI